MTRSQPANGSRSNFGYDNANRLDEVVNLKSTNVTISSYEYALNAVGNRTSARENGVEIINWLPGSLYSISPLTRCATVLGFSIWSCCETMQPFWTRSEPIRFRTQQRQVISVGDLDNRTSTICCWQSMKLASMYGSSKKRRSSSEPLLTFTV